MHSIFISKPKKIYMYSFSLHCKSLSLSLCTFFSLSPPWLFHLHGQVVGNNKKKEKKKHSCIIFRIWLGFRNRWLVGLGVDHYIITIIF